MTEYELALSRLDKLKKAGNGFVARCPCHHDEHQSLSIKEGDDSKALLYCHAGCDYINIIKALDLHLENENIEPQIIATYDYTDAEGKLLYQVVRYHPKSFKQRRPDGKGDWTWSIKGIEPSLYHLPEVIAAVDRGGLIFIVEGEKDVDNLRTQGQIATTISGGASHNWTPKLIMYLHHAEVCIIPDNDKPGLDYATRLANDLYGWCDSLKMVKLPGEAKDASDYLETNPIDSLLKIVYNSNGYIPSGAVTREEYSSLKGHLIYLQTLLQKKTRKKIYMDYKV